MSNYQVIRTDTADSHIFNLGLSLAEQFGFDVALQKVNELERCILSLSDNPHLGTEPRYMLLRRQGYKVLITDKNLVFYKIDDIEHIVTIYAVVDQRQDYLSIILGL